MGLVVGIDPSFSRTGTSIYNTGLQECRCIEIGTGTSDGHHGRRCMLIAERVRSFIEQSGYSEHEITVFIESPQGSFRGEANDLPALYWIIVNTLEDAEWNGSFRLVTYPVSPNELFKFLTGKGRTPRVNKVVAVQKKYGHLIPDEFVVDYDTPGGIEKHADVYDSIGLAVLGECVLHPEKFTKAEQEAVRKIRRL